MPREDKPDFDEPPVLLSESEVAAVQAGLPLTDLAPAPAAKPAAKPEPVAPAAPAPDAKPVVEPIIETVPTMLEVAEPAKEEAGSTAVADPLEEFRAQLARMEHDNTVYREALEQILAGQLPALQPKPAEILEEIVFPKLEFTQDEVIEAQTSEAGWRAYSARLAQHNLDVAATVEQKMLRNIQAVIPPIITKGIQEGIQNELTRRENVAKGDAWEAAHPEFSGQIPRVMQIIARERRAHPDWNTDKLLDELGPIASKELRIPVIKRSSTPADTPPSPVATPGARPAPSTKRILTSEERDVMDLNEVLGPR